MRCIYAEHGICQLATRLANRVVPLDPKACTACKSDAVPMAVNRITASIACHAQRKAGLAVDEQLTQLAAGSSALAGYRLERYIHRWLRRLRITPPGHCGCESWVTKMNKWGVEGSLEHLDEITDALYGNLRTTYLAGISISFLTKPLIKQRVRACLLKRRS